MSGQAVVDDKILEGARRVLAEVGFHRMTVERVAHEAGLSRVTLHRRGLTKEVIVAALTERAVEEYRSAMWPVLTRAGTAREGLEQALEVLCRVAEANLDLLIGLSSITDEVFHEEEGDGEEVMTRSPFTDPLERLLRDGANEGTLRPFDPAEGATLLFNLVGQTYLHLRTGHRWSAERARKTTLDVALNGVLAR